MKLRLKRILFFGAWLLAAATQAAKPPELLEFTGLCDASAAAALDDTRFAVACNEDSRIRVYRVDRPGAPEATFDFTTFLKVDPAEPDTDIEGAARVGERIYWLSSHGRSTRGHLRPSRHRFFATRIERDGDKVTLRAEGRPYTRLLEDLLSAPGLAGARLADASRLPPEAGGLNLEGLAAGPGGVLWLGFRSPLTGKKALLVPLNNPAEVTTGKPAKLGEPVWLDLDDLGVRDLVFHDGRFLIIGGPGGDGGKFRFFTWQGPGATSVELKGGNPKGLHPEALVWPQGLNPGHALVISDDGGREIGNCRCKDLTDPAKKSFRAFWLKVPKK